jgi:hypothetical protein
MYQTDQSNFNLQPCTLMDASEGEYSEQYENSVSWLTLGHPL